MKSKPSQIGERKGSLGNNKNFTFLEEREKKIKNIYEVICLLKYKFIF